MRSGGAAMSTCCTTRRQPPLRRKTLPQPGQACSVCDSKCVTCSGANGTRSWWACPGCPPGGRELAPPDAGGLTRSEDGGFDEVDESFCAAASCSWRRPISSRRERISASNWVTRCCQREHCGHGG